MTVVVVEERGGVEVQDGHLGDYLGCHDGVDRDCVDKEERKETNSSGGRKLDTTRGWESDWLMVLFNDDKPVTL